MTSKKKKRIAVVTGSRSDFGLLEPVMRAISKHKQLDLRVIVAGLHLVMGTDRDVAEAGVGIDTLVPMQRPGESGRSADVTALGVGVVGMGAAFERLSPDVVVVLGDRIEALAGALAAQVGGIHLAHLHGGDRAEGVADESMRHAITKLAHLHFPGCASSKRRLVRMGEDPRFIYSLGSPAVDGMTKIQPDPDAPDLVIVQHPIGGNDRDEEKWMTATLRATQRYTRIILAPNHDPGHEGIRHAVNKAGLSFTVHLPHKKFRTVLAGCRAIVGNSSSGLIEAAVLKKPCVNVGPRQNGREKPRNVIDCDNSEKSIRAALDRALSLKLARMTHPYGQDGAGKHIAGKLASINLASVPLRKRNRY
ncbi:MAG: UDP-N-acetylglucosamine 2-epimerase (hydrolyzing) [Phycisphaera sp.]|nr:UDP-N-acetylglucosamine 2-epimerase (hydrolyzing) [Phycisphaera sp.]